MSYNKCPKCGQEIKVDYFKLVNKLKRDFHTKYNIEPTHLVVGLNEYYDMEESNSILDRMIHIKDTLSEGIGTVILGLKLIKTADIEGIRVAKL